MPTQSNRNRLESLTIKGFKTIRALVDFKPTNLNVLIGSNGAGKTNLIAFFRLMSFAFSGSSKLQEFVRLLGGARHILHDGPDRTHEIEAKLSIRTPSGINEYEFRLVHAAGDTLEFARERCRVTKTEWPGPAQWFELSSGHKNPEFPDTIDEHGPARIIHKLLQRIVVYQLHNTAFNARIRGKWGINDAQWLKEDAANIAPVLYRLQHQHPPYYRRIVDTIRMVVPQFEDFLLEPDYGYVLLQWRERGTAEIFDSSQASDGFLRIVSLVTLLLQPTARLPDVLLLDEPELGLHPSAASLIGGLIAAVATRVQVIVATQSVSLVDCFNPEDIVVVERPDRASTLQRLNPDHLKEWLKTYSLSELWEKNIIGGNQV